MRKGKSTSVSKHRIAREHDHTHILVLALKTTTPTVVKCFIDFYCNDGIIKKNHKKKISTMIYKSHVYVIPRFSDIDSEVNFDFRYAQTVFPTHTHPYVSLNHIVLLYNKIILPYLEVAVLKVSTQLLHSYSYCDQ